VISCVSLTFAKEMHQIPPQGNQYETLVLLHDESYVFTSGASSDMHVGSEMSL
jgi:hypothetical protein